MVSNILHVFSKQYLECLFVFGLRGFLHFRQLILCRKAVTYKAFLKITYKDMHIENGVGSERSSP